MTTQMRTSSMPDDSSRWACPCLPWLTGLVKEKSKSGLTESDRSGRMRASLAEIKVGAKNGSVREEVHQIGYQRPNARRWTGPRCPSRPDLLGSISRA